MALEVDVYITGVQYSYRLFKDIGQMWIKSLAPEEVVVILKCNLQIYVNSMDEIHEHIL